MMYMLSLMFVITVGIVSCVDNCEKGWIRFNESCYHFSTSKVNWYEAAGKCYSRGAHLASMESKVEYIFLKHTANTKKGSYWIDAVDEEKEGTWVWSSSGKSVRVTDWAKGEPGGNTGENCALMYSGSKYQWHDNDCLGRKWRFICEKDLKRNCNDDLVQQTCRKLKSILEVC